MKNCWAVPPRTTHDPRAKFVGKVCGIFVANTTD
jgi:hypothetical protein